MLTLERNPLPGELGRIETKELCELAAVLGVLVNTEFQVLAEHLIELGEGEMLRGRSIPLMKLMYSGMMSSQSSVMKAWWT
jgi:hypothetical protein